MEARISAAVSAQTFIEDSVNVVPSIFEKHNGRPRHILVDLEAHWRGVIW